MQVDAIYTDLTKAFDKVNHSRLLSKVWNIGVRGNLFSLLSSYLDDRLQAVRINNCTSSLVAVTSGVPQGSYLGPLLFCIYINDIIDRIQSAEFLLYADDIKLFMSTKSVEDAKSLQQDLNSVAEWSDENGLTFNINKCHAISYYKGSAHFTFDYCISAPLFIFIKLLSCRHYCIALKYGHHM